VLLAGLLAAACGTHRPPAPAAAPPAAVTEPSRARPSAAVSRLRADLDAVFDAPLTARGLWAVDIRALDRNEILYQRNAGRLMMPASNLKILTLAAAAATLGWDHRYTTTIETSAPVVGGVLQGDLVVRGSGDPSINARDRQADAVFEAWIAALEAAGIRRIDGRVVGDDQAFDDEGLGAGWSWDDLQYDYSAPVGALQLNEGTAALTVTPGMAVGDPAIVRLAPGSGLDVINHVITGTADSVASVAYRRPAERPVLELRGSLPLGGAAVERQVAVVNPTVYFAASFKAALEAHGIAVSGEAADFDDVAGAPPASTAAARRVLATATSPPLSDVATVLMKVSQNLYAQTLLKSMGAHSGGLGTADAGLAVVRDVLEQQAGVRPDELVMVDGSGLSRYNYVTANAIARVLAFEYRQPDRDRFVATLPIAATDGTLASRMAGTRAAGNAAAKTGSLSNVRTLSGYVRTRDGEMLSFVLLANAYGVASAAPAHMADLAVEILSNFTRTLR
jgi:serine-type D-Ala-D-Ala carboxypeptidase/endopeptidase (penicillin-binding protein 4)